jgi:hypothetical protein
MKYENYGKAKELVAKINDLNEDLNKLTFEGKQVVIQSLRGYSVFGTIDASDNSESRYKEQACVLIDYVKKDIESQIKELNEELEKL